jgi:hypothetical protein
MNVTVNKMGYLAVKIAFKDLDYLIYQNFMMKAQLGYFLFC